MGSPRCNSATSLRTRSSRAFGSSGGLSAPETQSPPKPPITRLAREHGSAAQRVGEVIGTAVARMVDDVPAALVGGTFQQAQLAQQRREVGDADTGAREQRQRFEVDVALALVGGLVGDASVAERRHDPLSGVSVAGHLRDAILPAQRSVVLDDLVRVEWRSHATHAIDHNQLALAVCDRDGEGVVTATARIRRTRNSDGRHAAAVRAGDRGRRPPR